MCGIAGYINYNPAVQANNNILEAMCRSIIHRGPDDQGLYCRDNAGLGMRRLSIIDLTGGHQPIHNEDGSTWIVYNGETYNFLSLRKELQEYGHRFYTNTDTEVLIHMYEQYGPDFAGRLEGMFAFCIWDSAKRQLLLGRDRLGQKPLFYAPARFIFGSEIKAILAHPGYAREIEPKSVAKYLFYGFVPTPHTIFKGICQLEPGHSLLLDTDKKRFSINRFFRLSFTPKSKLGEYEQKSTFVDLFAESVKSQMVSDVPVGVFLSGGIDSSLVLAMLSQSVNPAEITAFSIGFNESQYNESMFAAQVAQKLGIKNHLIETLPVKKCLEILPEVLDSLDQPIADPSIIPTYLLSRFTGQHVKVALSGDGGDELFGGYPKYSIHNLLAHLGFLPQNIRQKLGNSVQAHLKPQIRPFLGAKAQRFLDGLEFPPHIRNQAWIAPFLPQELAGLLKSPPAGLFSEIADRMGDLGGDYADIVDETTYLDMSLIFTDMFLVKVDRASMANSLEVRCPFLDSRVIDFATHLPSEFKIKGLALKRLLRKTAEDFLPQEIVNRPKMGFGIPLAEWSRGELKPSILYMLSREKVEEGGFFNYAGVEKLLAEHFSHKQNHSAKLWALLVFQNWYYKWLRN